MIEAMLNTARQTRNGVLSAGDIQQNNLHGDVDLPQEISTAIREILEIKGTNGVPRVRAILKRDHGIAWSKYRVH